MDYMEQITESQCWAAFIVKYIFLPSVKLWNVRKRKEKLHWNEFNEHGCNRAVLGLGNLFSVHFRLKHYILALSAGQLSLICLRHVWSSGTACMSTQARDALKCWKELSSQLHNTYYLLLSSQVVCVLQSLLQYRWATGKICIQQLN